MQQTRPNSKSGALVIHSPSLENPNITGSRPTYLRRCGLFEADQWNSKIVDEVHPIESDIVLNGRTNASALEGTELRSIVEENGIQSIILIGFLSDGAIVDTAIALSDYFPDLNIMVCRDVTASESNKHKAAMSKIIVLSVNYISHFLFN